MLREEKMKALDAALGQIEKQYGKGAVMKLGDSGANMNVETIPTGCLSLDLALGLSDRACQRAVSWGFTDLSPVVGQPLRCIW